MGALNPNCRRYDVFDTRIAYLKSGAQEAILNCMGEGLTPGEAADAIVEFQDRPGQAKEILVHMLSHGRKATIYRGKQFIIICVK